MVTEAHRSSAECENFEMPFRGILNESFNQPIFGCNNLQATILYYDDQPFTGTLTIRINFVRGGAGTFLGVFNRVLLATRQQMEQQRRSQQHIPPLYIPEQPTSVQDYLPNHNAAFVDPQDPSTLYTTQPTMNATPRQDIPSWSISGQGLRRR